MSKARVVATVKVRAYAVTADAVERGVMYGWRRAHKHTSKPDEDFARELIAQAVLSDLCEVLDFGDDEQ